MLKPLRTLPTSLAVLFWTFLFLPFAKLLQIESLLAFFAEQTYGLTALSLFVFFLCPLLICFSILRQSFLVVGLFVVECISLFIYSALTNSVNSKEVQFIRVFSLVVMGSLGYIFANKEIIFPLFSRRKRFWRKHPRLNINARVYVVDKRSGRRVPLIMQDCSVSGMAVFGERELIAATISQYSPKETIKLVSGKGPNEMILPMEIAQVWDVGPTIRVGLRALDETKMREYILSLKGTALSGSIRTWLAQLWVRPTVRYLSLAVWIFAVAGSFLGLENAAALRQLALDTAQFEIQTSYISASTSVEERVTKFDAVLSCPGHSLLPVKKRKIRMPFGANPCAIKLTSFSLADSETFQLKENHDFKSMAQFDTATFTGNTTTNEMYVLVKTQLPKDITGHGVVEFAISEGRNFKTIRRDIATKDKEHLDLRSFGERPPNFTLKNLVLTDRATLIAECNTLMNQSGLDAACNGEKLRDIKLVFTHLSKLNRVDKAQLTTLFLTAKNLESLNGQFIEPESEGLANGGFRIEIKMDGVSSKELLIALQGVTDESILYTQVSLDR